jgi:arginyl-tRNA synthetase
MTPDDLAEAIAAALDAAVAAGELSLQSRPEIRVERPKNREHGDWSTNVAMQVAKPAGLAPRAVAELLVPRLAAIPGITKVDIAGPGFLNVTLEAAAAGELARTILTEGDGYGRTEVLKGLNINVEFISANPNGPLHLGHARWAAVGDAIASVLEVAGAQVTREFYINDRGVQLDNFAISLMAVAHGEPIPEGGYHGNYITDLAAEIVAASPGILELPDDEQHVAFREAGYALQLGLQRATLENFRTHFDVWASERELHESGAVERGMDKLREQGHIFENDGAVWVRTTEFGDDRDRVIIRTDGNLTYFAADIAYYVNKRDRGFDIAIYLLGADHHGYVGRLKAVAGSAGDDTNVNIEVLIGQLVKMMKNGEEVRLSKRAGDILTLDDLVDEVGVDAARYSLIRYPVDSPLVLDLDLLVSHTNENPVYYVQYAHARLASLLRNAAELGIAWQDATFDPALLSHPREGELLGVLAGYPRVVATAAELREPHRVARYLEELGAAYHRFYDACRVLPRGDEAADETTVARLWLSAAARQVLANGLNTLHVSAPERM